MKNLKTFNTKAEYEEAVRRGEIPNPCVSVVEGKVYYYPDSSNNTTPSEAELRLKNQVLDLNEGRRIEAEKVRVKNEEGRIAAENARVESERLRTETDKTRTAQIKNIVDSEVDRNNAENRRRQDFENQISTMNNLKSEVGGLKNKMPYIGDDLYVYEWSDVLGRFERTTKYTKGEKGDKGDEGRIRLPHFSINPNDMCLYFDDDLGEFAGNYSLEEGCLMFYNNEP